MNSLIQRTALAMAASAAVAGVSSAAEILVASDITTSTTWTAGNTYNLQQQIYVKNGATLTIEAGTILASTTNIGGSLAVARGAKIRVLGTAANPVIMTSKADDFMNWREGANEWGNLTIMGQAFISEDATAGNVPHPDAGNVGSMEGLIAAFPGDPDVLYGGGDDDDDSGEIHYLSLRYGGKVVGLNNELNGLSLGGIGRGTDIDHVDIMNNVDDGIEIWGGTVNLSYLSIWNIGDDSLDIDQGYRGQIQNVLIVQGYSVDASQGSGVGDNCVETDGAENSDWQPVTTTTIYNATIIGQPIDGDGLTAWRDNARVQYRRSIFMDCGEKVVRFDNVDGDGALGYGHNGTLDWPTTWATSYTSTSSVNPPMAPLTPADLYKAQADGNLCDMKDSVFFQNFNAAAYTEANGLGVFAPANENVLEPASSPIASITRGGIVSKGGKNLVPVTFLDPRAANDAAVVGSFAPTGSFFRQQEYRGAFGQCENWIADWTAAADYGMTSGNAPVESTVTSRNGAGNTDFFDMTPAVMGGVWNMTFDLASTGKTLAQALVWTNQSSVPYKGQTILAGGLKLFNTPLAPLTTLSFPVPTICNLAGVPYSVQAVALTPGQPGFVLSQARDGVYGNY